MSAAVLHLSPHPDDELIGSPATLMALRDAGWRVVNLACGLGRPDQRARREAELREACGLAGFELRLPPPAWDERDRAVTAEDLTRLVAEAVGEIVPAVVVSPGPGDRHPAHEAVARAARDAVREMGPAAPRWWTWALWGPPPEPTFATRFDEERLEEILAALSAHRGELERNDYRRLVHGRAEACACLAPELLFGFGSAAEPGPPYAELLSEAVPVGGRWRPGRRRWLDPADPLPEPSAAGAERLADPAVADQGRPQDPFVGEVEGAAGE